MTAWKTDNKQWMKERKEAWKVVKKKIDKMNTPTKDEKKTLKNYFILGEESEEFPINKMEAAPLILMWLHPDHSDEHWQQIKDNSDSKQWLDARFRFLEVNKSLYSYTPDGGSFFDELEERMCHWFYFSRLKREDWPDLTDDEFSRMAEQTLALARTFDNYLRNTDNNPYDITPHRIPAWEDAMILAYKEEYTGLSWMIKSLCDVLRNTKNHPALVVKFAEKLQATLKNAQFPEAAKIRIEEIKKEHNCTF